MAGRAVRPLALVATAVVLVAFALGGWVPVARTTESPRRSTAAPKPATDPGRAQAEKAGIDVDAVVDKVRHRVTPNDDGSLAAHDERYRARFDATGFGFTLAEHSSRLGVSLRGVQRGADSLPLQLGAWTGDANVAVRAIGRGMTERVTARADELEWDVVLERALSGRGDLRIEAELQGLDGVATRLADHWRFPLGDGAMARMGEVVVKDATGAELHRALPYVRGSNLRLDVPASVLADARYPLTIDPVVGPEKHVGGNPVYVPSAGSQPAVASDGSGYFVVWTEVSQGGFTVDIRGARVSAGGAVLDPGGIPISTALSTQSEPAIAWNGTDFSNFLVVWRDFRSGIDYDIYGTRVTTGGSVLDPAGIPISTAVGNQAAPALARSGGSFLVAWQDSRSGTGEDIYGTRVGPAGNVVNPGGIALTTATNDQTVPDLAWTGTNYLVVWQDLRSGNNDTYGVRVSSNGTVLDPADIPISNSPANQMLPAVAATGSTFLVVWRDNRNSAFPDIYGARVSSAGVVLDPAGVAISTATNVQNFPAVVTDGTGFLVVWDDRRSGWDIYGARVSTGGIVLDPAGIPISTVAGNQFAAAVAWSGTNFLGVWQSQANVNSTTHVSGGRVSGVGVALDPGGITVSTAASAQDTPAVAWNGTNFLVVWTDNRTGDGGDIYGIRVGAGGDVLDPAGIPIAAAAGWQHSPAVAWNGTNFFVAWVDIRSSPCCSSEIRGARVSAAGSVLDPTGIIVSSGEVFGGEPALAWNGTDFLVVWSDSRADEGEDDVWGDIYGARVTGAGAVLDPQGIPIASPDFSDQISPAVAWNGTDFLVVWGDDRTPATRSDIYGARVSAGGAVLDAAGIPISTAANGQSQPAVASWGDSFFVVWADTRSGTSSDIYGAGVGRDGTVVQPAGIPISTGGQNESAPDLAVRYDFLVAWRDRRSGADDVYATRVSPAGVVHEPAGFLVASATPAQPLYCAECAPAVTGGPGTSWGIAYHRFANESPYGANRVFFRTVSPK